jgi:hypothetical protein
MVVWIGPLPEAICTQLNKRAGFDQAPPELSGEGGREWGAAGWGGSMMLLGTLAGHNAGCAKIKNEGQNGYAVQPGYQFYYTLWAR